MTIKIELTKQEIKEMIEKSESKDLIVEIKDEDEKSLFDEIAFAMEKFEE